MWPDQKNRPKGERPASYLVAGKRCSHGRILWKPRDSVGSHGWRRPSEDTGADGPRALHSLLCPGKAAWLAFPALEAPSF